MEDCVLFEVWTEFLRVIYMGAILQRTLKLEFLMKRPTETETDVNIIHIYVIIQSAAIPLKIVEC
jgi:hypothetical protein